MIIVQFKLIVCPFHQRKPNDHIEFCTCTPIRTIYSLSAEERMMREAWEGPTMQERKAVDADEAR